MTDADANQSLGGRVPPTGWQVRRVAETGSTNADMVVAAQGGAPHHSVLVADFQSRGRGRLDRQWEAAPGANLLTSLLFRPHLAPDRPMQQYTHMVGLAARAASRALADIVVDMKWPNDLLVDDRKLAGILAQGSDDFVVVGIGINVAWSPEGAVCLRDVSGTGTIEPLDVLMRMLVEIDRLEALSVADMHREYVASLSTIGREVRIERVDGTFLEGRALDVQADGRLVVVDSCAVTHRVDVGDVTHLRRQ